MILSPASITQVSFSEGTLILSPNLLLGNEQLEPCKYFIKHSLRKIVISGLSANPEAKHLCLCHPSHEAKNVTLVVVPSIGNPTWPFSFSSTQLSPNVTFRRGSA